MFNKNKKTSILTEDEKLQKRAELLYGNTKENKKLSKSIYDNDNDEIKGELDALVETNTRKKSNTVKEEKDYNKTADLLYPTMKNKTNKIDSTKPNRKINDEKIDNFTGGAAAIKNNLKSLGLNDNDYEIKDGSISPVRKKKEYEIIDNIKYPNNTGNKKVEEMLNKAKQERSEKYKKDTEDYLKIMISFINLVLTIQIIK